MRAIAIDDWSWRKGFTYGTIIVDLERRAVADVLETGSVKGTADWLKQHAQIEIVSRDGCGLYAQGVRQGAPQARQIADRFHLLQNLRENIESQLTAVSRFAGRANLPPVPGERQEAVRGARGHARQALFDQAKLLHAAGRTYSDIAKQIGLNHRTVAKWIKTDVLPHRRRLALKPSSPLYFKDFLTRRWAEGDRVGRRLFHDIRNRGYTGSFSNLERLLSTWRWDGQCKRQPQEQWSTIFEESPAVDPSTGRQISPVTAASLCMKPTTMLTLSDAARVAALKKTSPNFVVMRRRAFVACCGDDAGKLDRWLHDARHSGVRSMQQFARTPSWNPGAAAKPRAKSTA